MGSKEKKNPPCNVFWCTLKLEVRPSVLYYLRVGWESEQCLPPNVSFGFLGKAFIWQAKNIPLEGWVSTELDKGHQSLFHGDLKASVQDISVDLDTNYTLKPRVLGCSILIISLDLGQTFV